MIFVLLPEESRGSSGKRRRGTGTWRSSTYPLPISMIHESKRGSDLESNYSLKLPHFSLVMCVIRCCNPREKEFYVWKERTPSPSSQSVSYRFARKKRSGGFTGRRLFKAVRCMCNRSAHVFFCHRVPWSSSPPALPWNCSLDRYFYQSLQASSWSATRRIACPALHHWRDSSPLLPFSLQFCRNALVLTLGDNRRDI